VDSSNIQDSAKPQPLSLVSAIGTTAGRCDAATQKQGKAELGACLTLVSPSGLTVDDRKEWLAVAMQTLSGIPADLLQRGCAEARKRCRFPSEIVPAIIDEIGESWERRKKWQREEAMRDANKNAPWLVSPDSVPIDYVDPEEVTKLRKQLERNLRAGTA
jgi:hypothetical protein